MKVLAEEKIKALASKNGWSLAYANGYIDGAASRRRGIALAMYAQVGIDDYCLGVRAGYYERKDSGLPLTPKPAAPNGKLLKVPSGTKSA